MDKDYRAVVLTNIENEYYTHLENELKLPAETIYNDSRKNNFYMVIYELLNDENSELTAKDYKLLSTQGDKLIGNLYNSFLHNEDAKANIYEQFFNVVTSYIDKNLNSGTYM